MIAVPMSTPHRRRVARLCRPVRLEARVDELEEIIFAFGAPETLEFVHRVCRLVREAEGAYNADCRERVRFLLIRERHLAVHASAPEPEAVAHELCAIVLETLLLEMRDQDSRSDVLLRCLHAIEVSKHNRPVLH